MEAKSHFSPVTPASRAKKRKRKTAKHGGLKRRTEPPHGGEKNTSLPASQRTETEMRLLVMVRASRASRAATGSSDKRSSRVLVVNILAPAGWMIVLVGNCVEATLEGEDDWRRLMLAAESSNAVVNK